MAISSILLIASPASIFDFSASLVILSRFYFSFFSNSDSSFDYTTGGTIGALATAGFDPASFAGACYTGAAAEVGAPGAGGNSSSWALTAFDSASIAFNLASAASFANFSACSFLAYNAAAVLACFYA